MLDTPGTILTIVTLVDGLLATAGYGLMSVGQYRAARVALGMAALCFTAIGLELGLANTWPLSMKMLVTGCFGLVAAGALVYAFYSIGLIEKPTENFAYVGTASLAGEPFADHVAIVS